MAGTAVLGRLTWQLTDVVEVIAETPRVKTIRLAVAGWAGHRAGQHVDVRLTAEYGYQAERSYSIASAPNGTRIELTVERLDDGEVSPYLTEELRPGDQIELRGPVGGYFVWEPSQGGPLLLVAGGSGVVPLMAMIRHRAATESTTDARLLFSSRGLGDIIYRKARAAERRGAHGRAHVDAIAAARLERLRAPRRRRNAGERRPGSKRAAAGVRLRSDAVRRGRGDGARAARPRATPNQDRALRTNGRLRWTP
jgi:ferredoxin-NADP reductase